MHVEACLLCFRHAVHAVAHRSRQPSKVSGRRYWAFLPFPASPQTSLAWEGPRLKQVGTAEAPHYWSYAMAHPVRQTWLLSFLLQRTPSKKRGSAYIGVGATMNKQLLPLYIAQA